LVAAGFGGGCGPQYTAVPDPLETNPVEASPIPLAPLIRAPSLPGSVIVRQNLDDLIDAVTAELFFHARNCVRAFGDFHLALSGGSTPEPVYRRLMYDPNFRELPWKRVQLWMVDERRVPLDDARSNFKMIRETIVDHSDIPREQVHPILATEDGADLAYEKQLQETLAWREKGHDRLDYVLLGMGADGHTASLFPHSRALAEPDRLVVVNAGPEVTPPDRITMTYRLLNASRFIAVMVTGKAKRDTIARVARPGGNADELPILGVRPAGGELRWYLDGEACP
jgi:6-phosphogluconolactonase